MMLRYLVVMFVCVALTNSQQCIKLVTSLCDDVTNQNPDDVTTNPNPARQHAIRGKAGPKGDGGEKGDKGQKGENSDQNYVIDYVITKMNESLSQLQGKLTDIQTRLAEVENKLVITCGEPIAVLENGNVTCTNDNKIGSVCTFTCDDGYGLSNITLSSTTCMDNDDGDTKGVWTSKFPQCYYEAICGLPIAVPDNGNVTCTNANKIGSVCTFTCDEGYGLSNITLSSTTCMDNDDGDTKGVWTSKFPQCYYEVCPYELRLTPRSGTFDEAQEMCEQMGGNLMQKSLSTGACLEKVNNTIGEGEGDRYYFIGLTDRVEEGDWKYLNGENFNEENVIFSWGSWMGDDEPNGGVDENCAIIQPPKLNLHDFACTEYADLTGICEI